MSRVRLEYTKAALTSVLAVAALAICVLARTLDAASLVIVFATMSAYFALKARTAARVTVRGCGQRPR